MILFLNLLVILGILYVIVHLWVWGRRHFLTELKQVSISLESAIQVLKGAGAPPAGPVFPKAPSHLPELWRIFLDERIRTTRDYQEKLLSTLAPEEIFSEEAILPEYNRNFSVAMAGIFTALGILGTFIGLAIGLVGVGVNPDAPNQLMDSVSQLLGGMSTAFITSICGIIASLSWLFFDRHLYNRVSRATNQFLEATRRHFPVESADRLLHRLLEVEEGESEAIKEVRDISSQHLGLAQDQADILRSLSFDLASAISEKIPGAIQAALGPSLDNLGYQLQELSVRFGDQQVHALDEMVESFKSNLSSEMSGQFEHLASTLAQTAEWQTEVHRELGELITRMDKSAEAQSKALDEQTKVHEAFSETARAVAAISDSARETASELNTAAKDVAEELSSIASAAKEHSSALTAAAETMVGKASMLDASLNLFRGANEQLREQLATQIDTIDEQVRSLVEFWQSFNSNLDGMGKQLAQGILEFRATSEERFKEIFEIFDSEMAKVVSHLGGTLADMRDTSENLCQGVVNLENALGSGTGALKDATTSLSALPRLEAPLIEFKESMALYREMPRSLTEISENLTAIRGAIRTIVSQATEPGAFTSNLEGTSSFGPNPAPPQPPPEGPSASTFEGLPNPVSTPETARQPQPPTPPRTLATSPNPLSTSAPSQPPSQVAPPGNVERPSSPDKESTPTAPPATSSSPD